MPWEVFVKLQRADFKDKLIGIASVLFQEVIFILNSSHFHRVWRISILLSMRAIVRNRVKTQGKSSRILHISLLSFLNTWIPWLPWSCTWLVEPIQFRVLVFGSPLMVTHLPIQLLSVIKPYFCLPLDAVSLIST